MTARPAALAVILAIGVLATMAQTGVVSAQSDTRAADERKVRETDMAWAKAAGAKDLERVLAFFADGASELAPNTPIATGRDALRKVWAGYFATPGFSIGWQPTKVEVSRGADLGYSLGTYTLTAPDPSGKPVTDRGKYVTIWKKQADGSWKVIADVFNSDLPAPPAR
jgi:ketosteroid isomerase-like protein